jgi:Na+/melibiose symporter-like transporter
MNWSKIFNREYIFYIYTFFIILGLGLVLFSVFQISNISTSDENQDEKTKQENKIRNDKFKNDIYIGLGIFGFGCVIMILNFVIPNNKKSIVPSSEDTISSTDSSEYNNNPFYNKYR